MCSKIQRPHAHEHDDLTGTLLLTDTGEEFGEWQGVAKLYHLSEELAATDQLLHPGVPGSSEWVVISSVDAAHDGKPETRVFLTDREGRPIDPIVSPLAVDGENRQAEALDALGYELAAA